MTWFYFPGIDNGGSDVEIDGGGGVYCVLSTLFLAPIFWG
jgi:hypothetical protein